MKHLITLSFHTLLSLTPVIAAEKVALVIGNNAYQHGSPLSNCINDARAVTAALQTAGFQVTVVENASLEQMEAKTLEFRQAALGAKAAWFHYSGHGAEVKGLNYLIPVDANVKEEFQVKHKAFALDQMLGALEEAGTPLKVVVLDCCRDNPFGRGWSRTNTKGLGQIENTPEGTIIAYATSPGKVAADGAGQNSPFTSALVSAIKMPGLDVKDIFHETGRQVLLATNKSQQPWINSSFFERYVLMPNDSPNEPASLLNVESAEPAVISMGQWQVVEQVISANGGYRIVWTYNAVESGGAIVLAGRKTHVDGKVANKSEAAAVSSATLRINGRTVIAQVEEINAKGTRLSSEWHLELGADGKTFRGKSNENGKVSAEIYGVKQ